MLINFVFLFFLGGLLGAEHPLILTSIHTLNQEWVHINGLGPWSDQLEMSSPESSETFGSRVLIRLDSQSGTVLLSHCGSAFVGIFRAGDLSVDILHPAQNVFCAKEEGLPIVEAFDVPIIVQKNDIIFALLPSKAGWDGIKPVDLQGAMYGVEAGDSESFTDFVKNLPKVLKDFNCSLMVCAVSDKPKGLCEPCKLMYSRSHMESFLSFDGSNDRFNDGFRFPFPSTPRLFSPMVFGPLEVDSEDEESSNEESYTNTASRPRPTSFSSPDSRESSPSFNPVRRTPRFFSSTSSSPSSSSSSSSSSSDESGGDYNYRSPRSSEVSSELGDEDTYIPGQNQESDRGLNTIPGFFTNTPGHLSWIQRRRPVSTESNFPDLNEPIPTTPFRPPRRGGIPVIQSSAGRGTARFIQVDRGQPSNGTGPESQSAPTTQTTRTTQATAGQSAGRGTARLGVRGTGLPVTNSETRTIETRVRIEPASTRPPRGRVGRVALQQQRANEEEPANETRVRPRADSDDENERESKRARR